MNKIYLYIIILFNFFSNITFGQFATATSTDATFLANTLAGAGVTISGATLVCGTDAAGTFTHGTPPPTTTGLGITDGVVLSSGSVLDIPGAPTAMAGSTTGGGSDPDLAAIISPFSVNDACILEFDIFVTGDSLKFDYVFGSEEYTSFVCNGYNDVFAFFISGINPSGGSYVNQNVALIPGTTTPVSINTVNDGTPNGTDPGCISTNTGFYAGAIPGIKFDGNTIKLTALAEVVPCTSYHFKLAIGDGGDSALDSGVFLEAGSFSSNMVVIGASSVLGAGFDEGVEGCVDGLFVLETDTPMAIGHWVPFDISGSATNGVDYSFIPDSVWMPAGDTIVEILVNVLVDGITEGTEDVVFTPYTPCGTLGDPTFIEIVDVYPRTLTPDQSLCAPTVVTLTATGSQYYNWQDSTLLNNDTASVVSTINPLDTTTTFYMDGVLGDCTYTDTTTVYVTTTSPTFHVQDISCAGANNGAYWVVLNSTAIQPITYSFPLIPSTDSVINNLGPGFQIAQVTDGVGCVFNGPLHIYTDPSSIPFYFDSTNISCNGENDGSFCIYGMAVDTYNIIIDTNGVQFDSIFYISALDTICLTNLSANTYDVSINTPAGCGGSFDVNIVEPEVLDVSISVMGTGLCSGGSIDSLTSNVTGGTQNYQYLWSNSVTTPNINGVSFGNYTVVVTDANGCIDSNNVSIVAPTPLYLTLSQDSVFCAGELTGLAYVDSISGGNAPYTYSWNDPSFQTNDTATVGVGIYTLTVSDLNSCTIIDSVEVFEPLNPLMLSLSTDTISCFGGDTCIDAIISGGTAPYTYLWNDALAQTTEDICNLVAGTYILEVTDAKGCQKIDSITIYEQSEIILAIDSTNIVCYGMAIGSAVVTVSGGSGFYTYQWDDASSQTTDTASNLIAGFYTVVVTDANDASCSKSISVNVVQPTDSILIVLDSITNVLCNNDATGEIFLSIYGGTIPYTYLWSDASTNEDLTNVQAGTYSFSVTDDNNCVMSLTDSISEPTTLNVNLATNLITCFGGDTCIDATISGGASPYTYLWSDALAQTTEDVCNLQAGTYSVMVTDSNLCVELDTITISEVSEIVLTLDSVNVLCYEESNGSATVNPTGGSGSYTFLWDDALAQTTAIASNLIAGFYTVVVTDVNDTNCSKSISVNIEQPSDSLKALLGSLQNVLCFGGITGEIDVNITGGTSPYSYNWSNSSVSEDLINVVANSYDLTVTDDNNCTTTFSDIVNEPFDLAIIEDSVKNIGCFGGNDGEISISVTGGMSPYTYIWNNGSTTQDISNLTSGAYLITVTDSNLCQKTATITISQPDNVVLNFLYSNYNGVNVSCNGGNDGTVEAVISSGGTSPFTYIWDNGMTGNPITGLSANVPINVAITDANGCNYSSSITTLTEPTILLLEKDSVNVSCAGANNGTATVLPSQGTPPYLYSWSNGQNTQTATNLSPNTYTCTVEDKNGCIETIQVTIDEPTPIVITTIMDSVRCWGESDGVIAITATGGSTNNYQYSIDGGETFQDGSVFNGLSAGMYDNIIIRQIGNEDCLSPTVSQFVFQPEPMFISINPEDTTVQLENEVPLEIIVDPSSGYYVGESYSISDITSVVWSPINGLNCADCLDPTALSYEHDNVYTATVEYSQYGCIAEASVVINVENNLQYFIPSAFSPNNDGINDMFLVYGEGLKDFSLLVFNRWGEKVFESNTQSKGWDGTFKGVLQNPGIYTYGFEAIYLDDKEISFKGSITLLK